MQRGRCILLLFGVVVGCKDRSAPASGSTSATVLSTVPGELGKRFSSIGSVAELPDGRVVVTDNRDQLAWVVNFDDGSARQLGRNGSGPGEYARLAGSLLRVAGDTVWLPDHQNSRFLVIAPSGELTDRMISIRERMSLWARTSDSAGLVYTTCCGFGGDTLRLLRIDPRSGRTDTLASLLLQQIRANQGVRTTAAGGDAISGGIDVSPDQFEDAWGVFPNGDVIVVRVSDYHAEVISAGGQRTVGPPNAYTPIPLDKAEQEARGVKNKPPIRSSTYDQPGMSPDGRFWVRRATSREDAPAEFDLFDHSARIVGHVALPAGTTLTQLGTRYIYVTRVEADGDRLLRVAYPQAPIR